MTRRDSAVPARDSFNEICAVGQRYPEARYAPNARLRMVLPAQPAGRAYDVHVGHY